MTWRIVAITTATVLFVAVPASAQVLRPPAPAGGAWAAGKVRDGDGWRNPTIDEALRLLGMEREVGEAWTLLLGGQNVFRPAVAILRQELEDRPEAELDEFAARIADMSLADTTRLGRVRDNAQDALRRATSTDYRYGGTPHRRSFDELVRVYETTAALVLEETGGTDPFLEASQSERHYDYHGDNFMTLFRIYGSDPEGRGRDYVLGVQRGSARPPPCIRPARRDDEPWPEFCERNLPRNTTWCRAGQVLHGDTVDAAIERRYGRVWTNNTRSGPLAVDGLPEAAAEWWSVCWKSLSPFR